MIIIGAGLAGLLAGNMLRHRSPEIIDGQKELPNNHSAVLRFRTSIVGDVTGVAFKKVTMVKSVLPWKNPVADALVYSRKNTNYYKSDRSITSGTVVGDRYIAPKDLIARLAKQCVLYFDSPVDAQTLKAWYDDNLPVISTMPMPKLMELLGYESKVTFNHVPGVNIKALVYNCDAYVSLVVPNPEYDFSRISITGNELIVECPGMDGITDVGARQTALQAANLLGLRTTDLLEIKAKTQTYAKILPISEEERRAFIHWASIKHNIFSLGRYATWRPGLLLDDLVQDIRLIDGWIQRRDHYGMAKAS